MTHDRYFALVRHLRTEGVSLATIPVDTITAILADAGRTHEQLITDVAGGGYWPGDTCPICGGRVGVVNSIPSEDGTRRTQYLGCKAQGCTWRPPKNKITRRIATAVANP